MVREVESQIQKRSQALKSDILYRVIAFSISGTYIVDFKADIEKTPQARFATRLLPDFLSNFATQLTFHNRRTRDSDNLPHRDSFQQVVNAELFDHKVSAYYWTNL